MMKEMGHIGTEWGTLGQSGTHWDRVGLRVRSGIQFVVYGIFHNGDFFWHQLV